MFLSTLKNKMSHFLSILQVGSREKFVLGILGPWVCFDQGDQG